MTLKSLSNKIDPKSSRVPKSSQRNPHRQCGLNRLDLGGFVKTKSSLPSDEYIVLASLLGNRDASHQNMEDYRFKTKPFKHQLDLFKATRELSRYGVFWEQGCGKTKPTIDTLCWLFLQGKVNGLLVLAPNGVHRNWLSDEMPTHCPLPYVGHVYHSSKANTAKHKRSLGDLMEAPHSTLAVLAMSYDGFMTNAGRAAAEQFLKSRKTLYVLDEATRIKSPSAKRTKAVLTSAKMSEYRRVLTGTPVANGPFDVFTVMKFLDLAFWKPYCLDSYFVFKHYFGVWKKGFNAAAQREFEYVVSYRNLEQLYDILKKHSSRVTKDQVLDLPPKLYSTRYFQLNPAQQKAYEDLSNEFMTFLMEEELITAPLVITRLLRLQQITSGYLPADTGDPIYMLGDTNPRMTLLADVIEDVPHKAIIWAKFRKDIDQIMALLGNTAVRYDGSTGPDDRAKAIESFQRGKAKWFVANPAAAGEGLTLHAARTVIYYNNSYKLTDRLQSEDRAHRIGQKHPVSYIDLVAEDTIDEKVTKALVKKYDVAAKVLGDEIKEWLRKT